MALLTKASAITRILLYRINISCHFVFEFTDYNEILLGKIHVGKLTKNYRLVWREKKKGKMGNILE